MLPVLNYTRQPTFRWRRFARGAVLVILAFTALTAGTWGWFYWGWRREQAALARLPGFTVGEVTTIGPGRRQGFNGLDNAVAQDCSYRHIISDYTPQAADRGVFTSILFTRLPRSQCYSDRLSAVPATDMTKRKSVMFAKIAAGAVSLILMLFLLFSDPTGNRRLWPVWKCGHKMRLLGQALTKYAEEHHGHYPDRLEDLIVQGYATADMLVCDSSADTPAQGASKEEIAAQLSSPGHVSYVYLGQGATVCDPGNRVLLCERPGHHRGQANILCLQAVAGPGGNAVHFAEEDLRPLLAMTPDRPATRSYWPIDSHHDPSPLLRIGRALKQFAIDHQMTYPDRLEDLTIDYLPPEALVPPPRLIDPKSGFHPGPPPDAPLHYEYLGKGVQRAGSPTKTIVMFAYGLHANFLLSDDGDVRCRTAQEIQDQRLVDIPMPRYGRVPPAVVEGISTRPSRQLRLNEMKLGPDQTREQFVAQYGPPDAGGEAPSEYLIYRLADGRELHLLFLDSQPSHSLAKALVVAYSPAISVQDAFTLTRNMVTKK